MIVIEKTVISLDTGEVLSQEIIGPARIDRDTYYKNLAGVLVNGSEIKKLAEKLLGREEEG